MRILGVETSCDDTALALLDIDLKQWICGDGLIASQHGLHQHYGGIVPELASREHLQQIPAVFETLCSMGGAHFSLDSIDGIAVTRGPGLLGPLLVGLQWAKGLSLALGKPYVGVNHLEGHIAASWLENPRPAFPYMSLIISGGHTLLIDVRAPGEYHLVGQTLDDAAGETFDKVAKMLGLGYPGGPHIDRAAQGGDPHAWAFPRPMLHKGYDFSFSGLKTACRQALASTNPAYMQKPAVLADFCASFQQTVVDVVLEKLFKAAVDYKRTAVTIGGGVAANSVLRAGVVERAAQYGIEAFVPARRLCTDNGWMIAAAGARRLLAGERDDYRLQPLARWPVAAVMVQEVLG